MNLIKIGKLLGELEGNISNIDCGSFVTKKNETNSLIKRKSIELIRNLEKQLSE